MDNTKNLMTNAMEKMTQMLIKTDEKLAKYGVEPYGMKRTTAKEQREMFDNLTPGELENMLQTYGPDAVNEFLGKYMPKEE